MRLSHKSQGYTIWQTPKSIQLSAKSKPGNQSSLICKCRNYQSALRIASELANQHQLTLIMTN